MQGMLLSFPILKSYQHAVLCLFAWYRTSLCNSNNIKALSDCWYCITLNRGCNDVATFGEILNDDWMQTSVIEVSDWNDFVLAFKDNRNFGHSGDEN